MMLPCGILDGKCQQEWIWAHPWTWILIIAIPTVILPLIFPSRRGR